MSNNPWMFDEILGCQSRNQRLDYAPSLPGDWADLHAYSLPRYAWLGTLLAQWGSCSKRKLSLLVMFLMDLCSKLNCVTEASTDTSTLFTSNSKHPISDVACVCPAIFCYVFDPVTDLLPMLFVDTANSSCNWYTFLGILRFLFTGLILARRFSHSPTPYRAQERLPFLHRDKLM